jgi:hypothetical protein
MSRGPWADFSEVHGGRPATAMVYALWRQDLQAGSCWRAVVGLLMPRAPKTSPAQTGQLTAVAMATPRESAPKILGAPSS